MTPITLLSYNIHKGMSPLNKKPVISQMGGALAEMDADILCLQEVQGCNVRREMAFDGYFGKQHDWFGEYLKFNADYGQNVRYAHGNHGNATFSRHTLDPQCNVNITVSMLEKRGVLHSVISPKDWDCSVVVLNAHLNLLERHRTLQYQAIADYIHGNIDPASPVILAGDFNDWMKKSGKIFQELGFVEAFGMLSGTRIATPATFPARAPVLSLDRIYARNLKVLSARVHKGEPWAYLSDHLPISATFLPKLD